MARRRIHSGTLRLTPERHLALTIGPEPVQAGQVPALSDELLEALWWKHRERLLADAGPRTRPWAYWQFEAVPPHLRGGRPQLVEVERGGDYAERRARLERERTAWLAESEMAVQ